VAKGSALASAEDEAKKKVRRQRCSQACGTHQPRCWGAFWMHGAGASAAVAAMLVHVDPFKWRGPECQPSLSHCNAGACRALQGGAVMGHTQAVAVA
jgi:hypothetical protein